LAREHLHRVVDSECRDDFTTRRVEIEVNVLATILALQEQKLHDNFVRVTRIDFALKENDSVLQKQISQRHLTLSLVALVSVRIHRWLHGVKSVQGIDPYLFRLQSQACGKHLVRRGTVVMARAT